MFLMRRADHPLRATTVAREGLRIVGRHWLSVDVDTRGP